MDLAMALIECQARERALMVELNAAKIALVQAEGRESNALLREEAANREKEAALRDNETLRASTVSTEVAVGRALDAQRERLEREAAKSLSLAQYERDQRSIWLRSPEAVLSVFVITAQNGYGAEGFRNLSRAFRYDEQLWDVIKDRRGGNGITALMFASFKGDTERVRWLLARSASLDLVSMSEHDLYRPAPFGVNVPEDLKEILCDYFGEMSALYFACAKGHLDIVKLLLDKGARDNEEGYAFNALKIASQAGHTDIVRLLIEKGCSNMDFTGETYNTPLMMSIKYGHNETSLLLIESGADINDFNLMGLNALALSAKSKKYLPVFCKLLEVGADVNASEEDFRYTALMAASEYGCLETAEILLEKGADVNVVTSEEESYGRNTALILASENGHLKLVELLLSKGADKNIRNAGGKNAFDVAKTAQVRKALK